MPDESRPPDDIPAPAPRRERVVTLRLDADLHDAATKRLAPYGLAAVVRALLRAYLRGEIRLSADDLQRELLAAPRKPRRRKPAK